MDYPKAYKAVMDLTRRLVKAEAEVRELKRATTRENVDLTYLKNILLKFLEDEELEAEMFHVISSLLHFSPEEILTIVEKKKKKWRRSIYVPQSPTYLPPSPLLPTQPDEKPGTNPKANNKRIKPGSKIEKSSQKSKT